MAKTQKNKKNNPGTMAAKQAPEVSERVEKGFNILLKIMGWVIGLSFTAVVIIPDFNFPFMEILVKILFFLAIFNLLLFAFIEMFGPGLKKILSKIL